MMKRVFYILASAMAVLACTRVEEPVAEPAKEEAPVKDNTIAGKATVVFDDSILQLIEQGDDPLVATRATPLASLLDELGIESIERVFPDAGEYEARSRAMGMHRFYTVTYKQDIPVTKAVASLETTPGIILAEPVRNVRLRAFNDTYFSRQWHYVNYRGNGADINVQEVWDNYTTGDPSVIVCVVDEAIDTGHEDLVDNLWSDSQGHHGKNFVNNSWNLSISNDDIGHGTHVAGTIAAVSNNGKGVSGVAGGNYVEGKPGVKLMSCQIFAGNSSASDNGCANAIKFGADNGALISQNSWGDYADYNGDGKVSASELANFKNTHISAVLKAAIDYFITNAGCDASGNQKADSPMKGGLVIFAAGNEDIDYDPVCVYEPVIAVGAFRETGIKASYSNYGDWIDLGAPGGEGDTSSNSIWSTVPKKLESLGYSGVYWAGTSMACPHVSGVAALLISYFGGPGFTADKCKEYLMEGAVDGYFTGTKKIGKKLDALGSFQYAFAAGGGQERIPIVLSLSEPIPATIHQHQSVSVNVVAEGGRGTISLALKNAPSGVDLSGNKLTINGPLSQAADHNFKIIATDAVGTSATLNVSYTILLNHAPKMTGELNNMMFPAFVSKTVDLSSIFADEDEETPFYSATSSNTSVVNVSLTGSQLSVTPAIYGDAEVEVAATDALGLSAKAVFKVAVFDPSQPSSVYPQTVSDKMTVRITAEDQRETKIVISTTSGAKIFEGSRYMSLFSPTTVNVKHLAPGYYSVAVTYSGQTHVSRVVKL